MKKMEGVFSNLVIPFQNTGDIDESLFIKLVEFQIQNGVKKFIVNDYNAEYIATSIQEKINLLSLLKQETNEDTTVVASVLANNTNSSSREIQSFSNIGCDFILLYVPSLDIKNKIGIYNLIKESVKGASKEFIIDIPDSFNVGDEEDAFMIKNIINLKEVVGIQANSSSTILKLLQHKKTMDKNFKILMKNEIAGIPSVAYNIDAISMEATNIIPKEVLVMFDLVKSDLHDGMKLYTDYYYLFNFLQKEASPVLIKSLLSSLGLIEDIFRVPLHSATSENKREIKRLIELFDFKTRFKNFHKNDLSAYKEL